MNGERGQRLAELERALGHAFERRSLLETALRHSSFAHEDGSLASNERLEFLGDAVIGLVCADLLFAAHPEWAEGDLTRALHNLVDRRALSDLARDFDLGACLDLGRTERQSGGEQKDTILADALEAVLGALYLDGGLEPVVALARRVFAEALAPGAPRVQRDPKTGLQEAVMAQRGEFPTYDVVEDSGVEGDDERFRVVVSVQGEEWAAGVGRSKRAAERVAARRALERAEGEGPRDG